MRQKLVTLCDRSFLIAKKMPNFSRFVRQATIGSESEAPAAADMGDKQLLFMLHARLLKTLGNGEDAYDDPRVKALMEIIQDWPKTGD